MLVCRGYIPNQKHNWHIFCQGSFELPQAIVLQLVLLRAVHYSLRDAAPKAVDVGVVHEGASFVGS